MRTPTHLPGISTAEQLYDVARDVIVPVRDDDQLVGDGPGGTVVVVRHRLTVTGQKVMADVTELYCRYEAPSAVPAYVELSFSDGTENVKATLQLVHLEWVDGKAVAMWEAEDDTEAL